MNFNKLDTLKFLDAVRLKGQLETNEAIFNVNKNTCSILTTTKIPVLAIKGQLHIEGEDIGEIGIGNIGMFRELINSIPDNIITITKKKNKLVCSNTEKTVEISYGLVNTEYIKSKITEDKYQTTLKVSQGNEFILDNNNLSSLLNYCRTLKADYILLSGIDKKLIMSLEANENELVAEFILSQPIKPFIVKFNTSYLMSILGGQTSVIISLQTNQIAYFKINTDTCQIEYLLAPIKVEDNDGDKKQ